MIKENIEEGRDRGDGYEECEMNRLRTLSYLIKTYRQRFTLWKFEVENGQKFQYIAIHVVTILSIRAVVHLGPQVVAVGPPQLKLHSWSPCVDIAGKLQ